jgi:hypothetical protein
METTLSLDKIVQIVTREVMSELARKGIAAPRTGASAATALDTMTNVRLDMSKFKTPIVTENALSRLHERAVTVIVPAGAIITPRAKEFLRERNISVVFE